MLTDVLSDELAGLVQIDAHTFEYIARESFVFNDQSEPGFFQRRAVALVEAPVPAVTEVDIVNGCCMMIGRSVFERIGLIYQTLLLGSAAAEHIFRR